MNYARSTIPILKVFTGSANNENHFHVLLIFMTNVTGGTHLLGEAAIHHGNDNNKYFYVLLVFLGQINLEICIC